VTSYDKEDALKKPTPLYFAAKHKRYEIMDFVDMLIRKVKEPDIKEMEVV